MVETLLQFAPLALVLAPLLRGRFVGERTIQRMRDHVAGREPRRQRPARVLGLPRFAPAPLPRGGRLIASSLAVRPPPSPLTA
jgi:hypothetical protein